MAVVTLVAEWLLDGQSSVGGLVRDSLRRLLGGPVPLALLAISSDMPLDMLIEDCEGREPSKGKCVVGSEDADPDIGD